MANATTEQTFTRDILNPEAERTLNRRVRLASALVDLLGATLDSDKRAEKIFEVATDLVPSDDFNAQIKLAETIEGKVASAIERGTELTVGVLGTLRQIVEKGNQALVDSKNNISAHKKTADNARVPEVVHSGMSEALKRKFLSSIGLELSEIVLNLNEVSIDKFDSEIPDPLSLFNFAEKVQPSPVIPEPTPLPTPLPTALPTQTSEVVSDSVDIIVETKFIAYVNKGIESHDLLADKVPMPQGIYNLLRFISNGVNHIKTEREVRDHLRSNYTSNIYRLKTLLAQSGELELLNINGKWILRERTALNRPTMPHASATPKDNKQETVKHGTKVKETQITQGMILDHLTDSFQTVNELIAKLKAEYNDYQESTIRVLVLTHIKDAYLKGSLIERTGSGKRNSPFRFRRATKTGEPIIKEKTKEEQVTQPSPDLFEDQITREFEELGIDIPTEEELADPQNSNAIRDSFISKFDGDEGQALEFMLRCTELAGYDTHKAFFDKIFPTGNGDSKPSAEAVETKEEPTTTLPFVKEETPQIKKQKKIFNKEPRIKIEFGKIVTTEKALQAMEIEFTEKVEEIEVPSAFGQKKTVKARFFQLKSHPNVKIAFCLSKNGTRALDELRYKDEQWQSIVGNLRYLAETIGSIKKVTEYKPMGVRDPILSSLKVLKAVGNDPTRVYYSLVREGNILEEIRYIVFWGFCDKKNQDHVLGELVNGSIRSVRLSVGG